MLAYFFSAVAAKKDGIVHLETPKIFWDDLPKSWIALSSTLEEDNIVTTGVSQVVSTATPQVVSTPEVEVATTIEVKQQLANIKPHYKDEHIAALTENLIKNITQLTEEAEKRGYQTAEAAQKLSTPKSRSSVWYICLILIIIIICALGFWYLGKRTDPVA